MALLRGRLLAGALFAGMLFGPQPVDAAAGGGYSAGQRAARHQQAEPVEVVDVRIDNELYEEDDLMLQLIITAITRRLL